MVEELVNISDLKIGDIVFLMKPAGLSITDAPSLTAAYQFGKYKSAFHVGVCTSSPPPEIVHITTEYNKGQADGLIGEKLDCSLTDLTTIIRFDQELASKIAELAVSKGQIENLYWSIGQAIKATFAGHIQLKDTRDFREGKKISDRKEATICSAFIAGIYKEATNPMRDQSKRMNISSTCLPSQLLSEFDRLKATKLIHFSSPDKYLEIMQDIINSNVKRMQAGHEKSKEKAGLVKSMTEFTLNNLGSKTPLEKIMILFCKLEPIVKEYTGLQTSTPRSYVELRDFMHGLGINLEEARNQVRIIEARDKPEEKSESFSRSSSRLSYASSDYSVMSHGSFKSVASSKDKVVKR